MQKRLHRGRAVLYLMAAATLGLSSTVRAQEPSEDAGKRIKGIAAGTDFFQTTKGTQASIMGTVVPLSGVPIQGAGNADTIVMRNTDAGQAEIPDFTSIPVTLEALNMTGTVGNCTVSITLAPNPASTGTMIITPTSATGGTFRSTLSVYYLAMFTPAANCAPTTRGHYVFSQKGGAWSTTPAPGAFIVSGPYGNPNVNQHTGLPPGIVDFYIVGNGRETALTNAHVVCAAFAAAGTPCPPQ